MLAQSKNMEESVFAAGLKGARDMRRWLTVFVCLALALAACNSEVQVDKPAGTSSEPSSGTPSARPPERGSAEDSEAPDPECASPGEIPKPADGKITPELKKQVKELLAELGNEYISGIEGPFIVLGNFDEEPFRRIMRRTIRACSERMYKQFFDKKPDYMLKVYLFADDTSYRTMAKKLWGDTHVSHFGYYKSSEKALVMNISTGTGTLVHEMFHALVEPDFDDIPSWFNEGVASLYECCYLEKDRLVGGINWRFPRLKQAIDENDLVPLSELVATTTRQFYGHRSDLHYAEARYFCMYLQKFGVLEKFYKKFCDNYKEDPTGRKFLEEILGKDLDKAEKDWVKWAKTLKYTR